MPPHFLIQWSLKSILIMPFGGQQPQIKQKIHKDRVRHTNTFTDYNDEGGRGVQIVSSPPPVRSWVTATPNKLTEQAHTALYRAWANSDKKLLKKCVTNFHAKNNLPLTGCDIPQSGFFLAPEHRLMWATKVILSSTFCSCIKQKVHIIKYLPLIKVSAKALNFPIILTSII